MVEITFQRGKARELRESDLSILIDMCSDEEILKYYFSSGTRNMAFYWDIQLIEQARWEGKISDERISYVLPIEQGETVKGCLKLDVKEDPGKRKRDWNNETWTIPSKRKDFIFESYSWVADLNPKKRFLSKPEFKKRSYGPSVEVSYLVGKEHLRKGLAMAAVRGAVTFSYDQLKARKVVAKVLKMNHSSRAVLEKMGFRVSEKGMAIFGPLKGSEIISYDLLDSILEKYFSNR